MISIRQAEAFEAEIVSSVLVEAVRWMNESNRTLWTHSEVSVDRIAADVERGLYFLAFADSEAVGAVRFQSSDPDFWPEALEGEAAYIHRLAVRRSHAGGMLSRQIMGWAASKALEQDCKYLRLDTESTREQLRGVYERFGFEFHSYRQVGPYHVARYQLPL
jgi:GNAT superfamily N-acetyltransferase